MLELRSDVSVRKEEVQEQLSDRTGDSARTEQAKAVGKIDSSEKKRKSRNGQQSAKNQQQHYSGLLSSQRVSNNKHLGQSVGVESDKRNIQSNLFE